jgi:hypothetical protein
VVFLTPPREVRAGECSEEIQIGIFGDAGVEPLFLAYSVEDGAGFFADSSCAQGPMNEFAIPGSQLISVYFKASTVGSLLVTASLGAENQVGVVQVQRVVSGRAGQLTFGTPISVHVGQCSSPLPIQVRDNFGNMTSVSAPLSVELTSTSSTTQFFSANDSTCATPLMPAAVSVSAGASGAAFRFRDSTPGAPIFAAMAPPDAGAEAPAPASQEQEIF